MSDPVKSIPNEKLQDKEFMRMLVARVMDDGKMGRVEACGFVAGMVVGAVGFDVYAVIDEDTVRRRKELYGLRDELLSKLSSQRSGGQQG